MNTSMGPPPVASPGILNPRLHADIRARAREFQNASPFRHVVMPDFFSPELSRRLLDDFPMFEDRFARGETGDVGRKAVHREVRAISTAYRDVDDFLQTPEFLNFISEITGIPDLLYDSAYHGGGTHENVHGASLYPHVDFNYHPKGWHRRLNLIVYLSPEWERAWGGSLELYSNPWDPSTDRTTIVSTQFNHAVLFETSERSWHGFRQINLPADRRQLSRKSFAIYLYTKERPADQTAASHSTVYVPWGIPDELQPGSVLTTGQYQLLKTRFSEYRSMLKFQYDRQQHLSEEYSTGYRSHLQGYAVLLRAPTGRWPDTWVSNDFRMAFTATKPVRGLRLEVAVPSQLRSDQVLEIRAGEWSGTEVLHAGEGRTLELPITLDAGESVEVRIRASATWSPGGGDTRELAYRVVSAILEH